MGSYSYCEHCKNGGLDRATIDEVVSKKQLCYHCGGYNEPNRDIYDVVEELDGRLRDMERLTERLSVRLTSVEIELERRKYES